MQQGKKSELINSFSVFRIYKEKILINYIILRVFSFCLILMKKRFHITDYAIARKLEFIYFENFIGDSTACKQ